MTVSGAMRSKARLVNSPAARIVLVLPAMFALGDANLRTGTEARDRVYWPIPRTLNVFGVITSFYFGDVAFDPSAPITRRMRGLIRPG